MNNLLITFIVLNIVNVVLQTAKSICTVKCGKVMASIINALAYGLYTVVIIYTVCDLPLLTKATVVALCNLVGVYVVKVIEERVRKDRLWKIELAVANDSLDAFANALDFAKLPYSIINTVGNRTIVNVYSYSQKESEKVKILTNGLDVKYFVSESKSL